jgi:hypothetical protein
MHAFEAAKPPSTRIPGLQEFAAAVSLLHGAGAAINATHFMLLDRHECCFTLSISIMAAGSLAVLSSQDPVTRFPCNSGSEG